MTWQAEAIKASGKTTREIANALKPAFPSISAAAVSLAMRPATTGITFIGACNKLLTVVTGVVRPRRDNRRCPIRIQARLTKADAEAFNRARRALGHRTVNDALVYALHWYIAEAKKRAAVDAGTSHDGKANIKQGHYMAVGGNCQYEGNNN